MRRQTSDKPEGIRIGAGKGNRTPLASLGSWCITTMLYPQAAGAESVRALSIISDASSTLRAITAPPNSVRGSIDMG